MRMIFKIAKTELQSLFYSPMAWLTLIVFAVMIGITIVPIIDDIVIRQAMGFGAQSVSSIYSNVYQAILGYLYLFIPLLTMNVVSRDLSGGTIKLLQSSPLYSWQIILGKYFALMVFGFALMGIFGLYIVFGIFTIENISLPYILTGLLGVYFLYCTYVAIGLFVSSLTSYQVVAALGTLAILSVLNYVDRIWQGIDFVRDITYWLSIKGRVNEFLRGLLCSEDVLYFIFVPAMFLAWAVLRTRNRIWHGRWIWRWGQYLGVLFVALTLGFLSSRPIFMCYYDSTREKSQTLSVNSQEIVKLLDGGLTITTYTNILEDNISWTLPENINKDKQEFRDFVRFKPETKLEYKYFYADLGDKQLGIRFSGMSLEERAKKRCEELNLNFKRLLSPEEMKQEIDLTEEGYSSVRVIKRKNGKYTFLRFYNMGGGIKMPFVHEPTLAGAYRRLAIDPPVIGFLQGHGERSIIKDGERDYTRFSTSKYTENSMLNLGFDIKEVALSRDISDEVDILVISALRSPLNDLEMANLKYYIDKGGNLIVLGEPSSTQWMNPLTTLFGIRFLKGCIVQPSGLYQPDLIQSVPSEEGIRFWNTLLQMKMEEGCLAMPGCSGIVYEPCGGFSIVPLMISGEDAVWNKVKAFDVVNDTLVYEPGQGDSIGIFTTAVALYREVGGKEQRILVLGDSDWVSNVEMMNSRKGVYSKNNMFVYKLFRWMSYDVLPVSVSRLHPIDNYLAVNEESLDLWHVVFIGFLPMMLVILTIILQVRRRSR